MLAIRKIIISGDRYTLFIQDSFETLEEILRIGHNHGADLALQSGDLFHDLFPSQNTLCNTLKIFEDKVFGEKEHHFRYYAQAGVDHSYMNLLSGTLL